MDDQTYGGVIAFDMDVAYHAKVQSLREGEDGSISFDIRVPYYGPDGVQRVDTKLAGEYKKLPSGRYESRYLPVVVVDSGAPHRSGDGDLLVKLESLKLSFESMQAVRVEGTWHDGEDDTDGTWFEGTLERQ